MNSIAKAVLMKSCLTVIIIFIYGFSVGQTNIPANADSLNLPKVFLIGEYEEQYGMLYEEYHNILLSVCNDDMNLAFNKWMDMLSEMEAYAESIDFDLKGLKVWLKVFWLDDGRIKHISYHLKPHSKNIGTEDLSAFFSSFMNHYQMPINTTVKYTHSGSAQFPTMIIPPESKKE